jgi:hypothetical protein
MSLMPDLRRVALCLAALAVLIAACPPGHAQAALLMEEPYGFFGALNPTGHDAIYFARICAETPIKLRRCAPDEPGSVFTRYQGITGYDWVAMPLIAYLYAVEDPSAVPARADRKTVTRLREKYHEAHLLSLGKGLPEGGTFQRGWSQLVGAAYERRMYAFRFATTEEQDDALIAKMNSGANHSRYSLFFRNCADFSRAILNFYFPRTFRRRPFPDGGITTPRQVTYELVRYARKHPETQLSVLGIPQVPGYRGHSRPNKSIAQSLIARGYLIPVAVVCPACAGGVLVDWLAWGRYPLHIENPQTLTPTDMALLTSPAGTAFTQSLQSSISPADSGQGKTSQAAEKLIGAADLF